MERKTSKGNRKPTKIEDLNKEQIREAIVKKRECTSKAQVIIERLLENSVTEEYFLRCLPEINQSHFEDVIEERSIIHKCGYPLCSKILSEKDIPKQKYKISLKTNKVYDISSRKSFCSNSCYKAAMYIKKQMLTSPLWFREYEDIPVFHILPLGTVGTLGEIIDVSLVEKINLNEKVLSTELKDICMDKQNVTVKDQNNVKVRQSKSIIQILNGESDQNEIVNNEHNNTCDVKEIKAKNKAESSSNKTQKVNSLNIIGDIIEKPERKIDPLTVSPAEAIKEKLRPIAVINMDVESCLTEWFTLDTLLFLLSDEKVKKMVSDKSECIKKYLNNYASSNINTSNSYDQYQKLCRRLNLLELEDRKVNSETLQRPLKPLPDYSILQEESRNMQLKVNAFLSGETEVVESSSNIQEKHVETSDSINLTQLPLVDKREQIALRRQIVFLHLNRILPDLLRSLGLLSLSVNSEVRSLVNTFNLKANNTMLKPFQWPLIAIVIIKLLSLKDTRAHMLLQQPTAHQHIQLLLLSYKQEGDYLERLVSWLMDVDRLLYVNDTQLTTE